MEHQATLLFTLAIAFVVAFVLGYAASRLHIPPLVGYLLAGIAIGPFAPGVHADSEIAGQLAEIGVILLMFGVGLHFSTADLMAVKGIAVTGAVAQIGVATAIGAFTAMSWGWSLGGGLVLGLALSVASTVVVLRALEERSAIETANGRIAIAWLVVEDLAMVMAESNFNPNATSSVGAMGLGQLMPGTAKGLGVTNAYDTTQNLYGTVRMIKGHLERYGKQTGNNFDTLVLSLAAYNAGSGAVRRHGGVPPYRETQNYIRKVVSYYRAFIGDKP